MKIADVVATFNSVPFVTRLEVVHMIESALLEIIYFIRLSYRNYLCICLNYSHYNFEQIKTTHICNCPFRCVFNIFILATTFVVCHFLYLLYTDIKKMSNKI